MRSCQHGLTHALCLGACLWACAVASAQYQTGFEPPTFTGSADGTVLSGQDGFYLPPGTESVDFLVYTYAGNTLGLPPNPAGGDEQFAAGTGPAQAPRARAQRDMDWGSGTWTITYDVATTYLWNPPAQNNIGSFSPQPHPDSASYIHLFIWVDVANPVTWNAFYAAFNAAGEADEAPRSPGPEWENLEIDHWYRFATTLDFDLNRIAEVSITDLTTGVSTTHAPPDWYMSGGAAGNPAPTAFRLYAGSRIYGNTVAWDNLSISSSECIGDLNGDGVTDLSDLAEMLGTYGKCPGDAGYNPVANLIENEPPDGCIDLSDLAELLGDYGCGT